MSWPTVKFAEVCGVLSGFAFKSEQFGDKGLPIARIRDVVRGYSETLYDGEYKDDYILDNGDMLIGMDGDFNLAKWQGGKALLNQRVCKLIPDQEKIDADFLFYYLPIALIKTWRVTPFVTVKHLSIKQINAIDVPLPSLPVQKQIAAVLEKADTLRSQCQQMEQELNSLSQSVFLDMFGKGYSATELGKHIDFVTSGSRGWAKYYSESGARFIRSLDVQMNYIGSKDIAYVNAPEGKEADRAKVQHGDVLLTITGSRIGRVCWVTKDLEEAYISQHVALLRLKKSFLPEFVSYFLSMPNLGQRQIEKAQYGQTKPGLNLAQIRAFTIPEVPMNEQIKFLQIVSSYNTFSEVKFQYEGQLNNLFNSLIQRAFKGELNLKDVA